MNNNEVQIWYYDVAQNGIYTGTDLVPANHVVKAGETFIRPEDGLNWPFYFVADKQRWIGTPDDQWVNPRAEKVRPDLRQRAMASLMKEVADMKTDQSQAKLNVGFMKQVAQLSITNATQDKLNASLMKQVAQDKLDKATQAKVNADAMKDIAALKIQVKQLAAPDPQPSESTSESLSTSLSASTSLSESLSTSQSLEGDNQ
ncbi:hypothetical protein [Limosilactobacillus sp.]|jgi:hypothetical protein|uniref:hypothetical protein n=1 Tax=Limosilactobacillus sp. TaxID=2773925 RepID=UPI0025B88473|nr:hypothetical protein [Limosilactobacillus sp.]MCH3922393.1 hypothetical protein [Limosilactobacillus sp.]MCH3929165.1 hypothetical protein [Limosilactobacillus sp.]